MRWTVTGHSESVSLLTEPHACSQACSQGQLVYRQAVTQICEDCEAIFLKGLGKEILIGMLIKSQNNTEVKGQGFYPHNAHKLTKEVMFWQCRNQACNGFKPQTNERTKS